MNPGPQLGWISSVAFGSAGGARKHTKEVLSFWSSLYIYIYMIIYEYIYMIYIYIYILYYLYIYICILEMMS